MDYSFLKFSSSISESIKSVGNPSIARIVHTSPIQLHPQERYLQITNVENGIIFNGDYTAEIVNCNDEVLSDITDSFAIYEFIDANGLNQIGFEFYTKSDYNFNSVHIKLTHTTGLEVYYTNPFYSTSEFIENTTRFDYKSSGRFNGISYDKINYFQSIRLMSYFDNVENDTETKEYYQYSTGNTISSRAQYKQKSNYKFDYIDVFTYERLNVLLIHDVVYVDSKRLTNKPQAKSNERQGFSNFFESNFQAYINKSETLQDVSYILTRLQLLNGSPDAIYTLATLPNILTLQFSKSFIQGIGSVTIKNGVGSIIATYGYNDFTKVSNTLTVDITGVVPIDTTNEVFTVNLPDGFVKDDVTELIETIFDFEVVLPHYDSNDYNSNDYLT